MSFFSWFLILLLLVVSSSSSSKPFEAASFDFSHVLTPLTLLRFFPCLRRARCDGLGANAGRGADGYPRCAAENVRLDQEGNFHAAKSRGQLLRVEGDGQSNDQGEGRRSRSAEATPRRAPSTRRRGKITIVLLLSHSSIHPFVHLFTCSFL